MGGGRGVRVRGTRWGQVANSDWSGILAQDNSIGEVVGVRGVG